MRYVAGQFGIIKRMICLWVTEWKKNKPEHMDHSIVHNRKTQKYRREFHVVSSQLLTYWQRSIVHFPWKSWALYKHGEEQCGSRYADLIRTYINFPILVSEEEFDTLTCVGNEAEAVTKGELILQNYSSGGLELFLLFHQNVVIDRSIGISVNHKSQFLSPVMTSVTLLNATARRLKGGVILGEARSFTSSTVLSFFARGNTSFFALIHDSDYQLALHMKKLFPNIAVWMNANEMVEGASQVIMSYSVWIQWKLMILRQKWHHVIIDECYVDESFDTKCLWIIDTEYNKERLYKWARLFQWRELMGVGDFEQAYELFLYYKVIFNHSQDHDWVDIQVSNRYIRFTEDYPFVWIVKALRNHDHIRELCGRILDLEYYDNFDLLYFMELFSNYELSMLPCEDLPRREEDGRIPVLCPVCHDEESNVFVKNEACSHSLCYPCMYRVNILMQKCPLCRTPYSKEFYRLSELGKNVEKPVMWKRPTRGRMNELTFLVGKLATFGKVVITTGLGFDYMDTLYDEVCEKYPQWKVMVFDDYDMVMVNIHDVIIVSHRDLCYLRHYPAIFAVISMELDLSRRAMDCIYYYFRSAQYKYVIAPAHGLTEVLLEHFDWKHEEELVSSMLSKIEGER